MTEAVGGYAFEPAAPADLGLDPKRIDVARAALHEQVASGRSPGLVAFVARRGQCFLHEAVGARNPAGDPMLPDTLFRIMSATKPLTAAVVMSLVEDGRIGLLQAVRDYLPEFPSDAGEGVLIHHLLTHTGGFDAPEWTGGFRRRVLEEADEDARFGRDRVVNAFLGCMAELKRVKPPGRGMLYANLNYELLGEIVRRVTGSPSLGAVMQERIFEPLGMQGAAMFPDAGLQARTVELSPESAFVALMRDRMGISLDDHRESDMAGGGLVCAPQDHATFQQMILGRGSLGGRRVLSKASVEAMTTNQIPGVPDLAFGRKEASWGYGFSVICKERWPYFGGGLVPPGTATHAGSGGITHWIDFEHEIVGVLYEVVTAMSEMMEPITAVGHRFQDVITAAVVD
jgi:CubicO group peptidase (beta-lactamase class C family)